jgi:putative FmdB family regulatory protein
MPLFEYRCEDCRRRFTLLVGMTAQQKEQACPRCSGTNLRKLISRFSVARSEDDLLDSIADPSALGDTDDPRAMANWMRKVGREMGEDLGDDFDELVEEAVREEMDGPSDDGDSPGEEGGDLGGGAPAMGGADDF